MTLDSMKLHQVVSRRIKVERQSRGEDDRYDAGRFGENESRGFNVGQLECA